MNVSMIFPFYNEESTIALTINSLSRQTVKVDEIIFVDSGSNDNSIEIIKKSKVRYPELDIKILNSGEMYPSNSINMGMRESRNNMVMYMDCGLLIPENWLESQIEHYKSTNSDIVSGKIYTYGINIVDKSFISHTYGYKNSCICLTGSLFDKKLFDKTGLFIEDCRAGYDVDFVNKLKLKRCSRAINNNVQLKYYGTNYSKTIKDGYKKVKLYSKSAWKAYGDKKPYVYSSILVIFISIMITSPLIYIVLSSLLYLLIRGFMIPYLKSKEIYKEKDLKLILMLPIIGLIFDLARINGYIDGLLNTK